MKIAPNKLSSIIFLSVCLAGLSLHNDAALAQDPSTAELVDLDAVAPDSGTALDEEGKVLPDTGTYVPRKKKPAQAVQSGGIAEPVEVIGLPTPNAGTGKLEKAPGGNPGGDDGKSGEKKPPVAQLDCDVEGVWQGGALTGLKVKAHNVGTAKAKQVKIKASLPGEPPVTLKGPADIEPGDVVTYTQTIPPTRKVAGNIKVYSTCDNCVESKK